MYFPQSLEPALLPCCRGETGGFPSHFPSIVPVQNTKRETIATHYCGLSHIMADSRQIIWRESLRSLCKHSTMTQKVLPHNVAWPFLPFLLSWCGPLSAAILCGRKRLMAPKVALMLKQKVLPDNVAPPIFSQIFLGADTKICGQHVFGRSRHIMRQK